VSERAAPPPVPFIGLTGAVAAGKSEALVAFARLGAQTLSSDALVHDLLGSEGVAVAIAERWGSDVAQGGVIDRTRVAEIVFERPEELRWLESQLHPLVGEKIKAWRESLPADATLAVVEVPLLFETGMEAAFDGTVAVVADDDVRAARAGERGTEQLAEREKRQLSQDEKAARATWVVRNDGSRDHLEAELSKLLPKMRAGWGEPA
jgi:dephospho-CoA kinase